jgi:hypothetical protein
VRVAARAKTPGTSAKDFSSKTCSVFVTDFKQAIQRWNRCEIHLKSAEGFLLDRQRGPARRGMLELMFPGANDANVSARKAEVQR